MLAWLRGVGPVHEDDPRVDHYLLLRGRPGVGVKARAGQSVEIKARIERHPLGQLAPEVRGHVERWRKWHFPVASSEPGVDDLDVTPEHWAAVHKRRWQLDVAGCEVEIAVVTIAGQDWHSLGLEAPDHGRGNHAVTAAVGELVAAGVSDVLALDPGACHGYPQQVLAVVSRPGS